MAAQGGVCPKSPAARAGDALVVKSACQGAGADASRELLEDAAYDLGLGLVDAPLTPDRLALGIGAPQHAVAVAEPAPRLALLDTAPKSPVGLGGEVLEKERVHGALEAHVKLADLAFGKRHHAHAGEAQVLEQSCHVRLVAAHAAQSLGEYQVELPALRIGQNRLHARA